MRASGICGPDFCWEGTLGRQRGQHVRSTRSWALLFILESTWVCCVSLNLFGLTITTYLRPPHTVEKHQIRVSWAQSQLCSSLPWRNSATKHFPLWEETPLGSVDFFVHGAQSFLWCTISHATLPQLPEARTAHQSETRWSLIKLVKLSDFLRWKVAHKHQVLFWWLPPRVIINRTECDVVELLGW